MKPPGEAISALLDGTHADAFSLLGLHEGPKSVFARTATRVNSIETEDCAALVLEMADGSFATLSVTLGEPLGRSWILLFGVIPIAPRGEDASR